jgi:flagellar biosynthesis protein FliP
MRYHCRVWSRSVLAFLAMVLVVPAATIGADGPSAASKAVDQNRAARASVSGGGFATININRPADAEAPAAKPVSTPLTLTGLSSSDDVVRTVKNVAIFGLISLAPAALLMVTSFPRINIVLILLRQALGSPQVPGNQVLTALSLLLTALVMRPVAEEVYRDAIVPYQSSQLVEAKAVWAAGVRPVKAYMVSQIIRYKHEDYLQALEEYAVPPSPGRVDSAPAVPEDFPLRVVAPAYLLSELTTAFMMGFYLYLPFLVIDLVVSSVLAATGLFMLPPSLVAMPVKLIVFVLADGWLHVAMMLLSSFQGAAGGSGP